MSKVCKVNTFNYIFCIGLGSPVISEMSNPPISVIYFKGEVEGRKEMFYLMTHSTHFIYGYMASDIR